MHSLVSGYPGSIRHELRLVVWASSCTSHWLATAGSATIITPASLAAGRTDCRANVPVPLLEALPGYRRFTVSLWQLIVLVFGGLSIKKLWVVSLTLFLWNQGITQSLGKTGYMVAVYSDGVTSCLIKP